MGITYALSINGFSKNRSRVEAISLYPFFAQHLKGHIHIQKLGPAYRNVLHTISTSQKSF